MLRIDGLSGMKHQGKDIVTAPAQGPQTASVYNAFLSYNHSDERLAAALQRGLHQLARPLFRLRALRVFRDNSNMGANPGLLPAIEQALMASEYLILLASPKAAASSWVEKEVDYWRRNKSAHYVLIALAGGVIAWDEAAGDFDWTSTTALPVAVSRVFDTQPRWVDFRWADNSTELLSHPRFRDLVAELAAPLHGRAKDELIGEDVRQARHVRRLTFGTIALLALLAVALGWMSFEANRRRQIAALERDRALTSQSRYLADAALRQIADGKADLGALLALEALPRDEQERPYVAEAEAALYSALHALGPREIAEVRPKSPPVSSATFSPDGKRLVVTNAESVARISNAETGAPVATLRGHEKPLWFARYLPDGSGIITGSVDGTARLWNAESGQQIRIFAGHQGAVLDGAISKDGRLLATASEDSTARLWRIPDGASLATFRGHAQAICCIQITPDGSRVATASLDGVARLWDVRSGKPIAVFKGTPRAIFAVAGRATVLRFSSDGKLLATSHEDNSVRLWHAADGSRVAVLTGASREITDAAFSDDNRFFAAASADGTARLWRLRRQLDDELDPVGQPVLLHLKQEEPDSDAHNAVVFSPESNVLMTAGEFLQMWDPESGRELAAVKLDEPASALVMSRDGRRTATIHLDQVTVWEATGSNFTRWRVQAGREAIERADRGPVYESIATGPGFSWSDEIGWEPPVAVTRDGRTAAVTTGRSVFCSMRERDGSIRRSRLTREWSRAQSSMPRVTGC